jgi:hypothetical protein
MGTITGPGVSWWDSFYTLLDPSSNLLYPGTGFTFSNPLKYKKYSDWTMGESTTNLIAGSGISQYVKQVSKQQYTQKILQTDNFQVPASNNFTMIWIMRIPSVVSDGSIIQWQSNNTYFGYTAQGEIQHNNSGTTYTTTGLGLTDNIWRHFAYLRTGTATSLYINGAYNQGFTLSSSPGFVAYDTQMFSFPGSDSSIGLMWFAPEFVPSASQVLQHYRAFRGRFGIR